MHTLKELTGTPKKAVGSIVGAAFFLLIFLSGYFFYTLSNQGVAAQQQALGEMRNFDIQRSQEALQQYGTIQQDSDGFVVSIKNTGPKPQNIVRVGFFDGISWNYVPGVIINSYSTKTLPLLIEAGGYGTIKIITPPLEAYKVQFLTDRGLILMVSYP